MGGPDPNPYAPPAATAGEPAQARATLQDASRWSRLGAALLDGLLVGVIVMPLQVLLSHYIEELRLDAFQFGLIIALSRPATWLVLNGFFLASSAQTIGKKVLRLQVVKVSDGTPASFVQLVAWRFLPIALLGQTPYVAYLVLVDALLIFRGDRRCVHDHVAGTRVVTSGRRRSG